jgi:hypothetical protein
MEKKIFKKAVKISDEIDAIENVLDRNERELSLVFKSDGTIETINKPRAFASKNNTFTYIIGKKESERILQSVDLVLNDKLKELEGTFIDL